MWACAEKEIQAARLLNPDNVEASKRIANLRRARREENRTILIKLEEEYTSNLKTYF